MSEQVAKSINALLLMVVAALLGIFVNNTSGQSEKIETNQLDILEINKKMHEMAGEFQRRDVADERLKATLHRIGVLEAQTADLRRDVSELERDRGR